MKSTTKNNLYIAEIVQVITHGEVIKENEIVDLNVLFLNLSNTFKVYSQSLATNVS